MLTKKVLDTLYSTFKNRPESVFDLNIGLLFDFLAENHGIELDEEQLVINSIEEDSPFHSIPLRHIHAIVEFGDDVAIVLHSSIIILNKHTPRAYIHLKDHKQGLLSSILHKMAPMAV